MIGGEWLMNYEWINYKLAVHRKTMDRGQSSAEVTEVLLINTGL